MGTVHSSLENGGEVEGTYTRQLIPPSLVIGDSVIKISSEVSGKSGSFATVYHGVLSTDHKGKSDEPCAIKVFKKEVQLKAVTKKQVEEEEYAMAVKVGAENHPNVVTVRGIWFGHPSGQASIVMERCMTSLFNELEENKAEGMPIVVKRSILKDVGKGMIFLTQHKVFHGDLTTKNILLVRQGDAGIAAKVTDFGLSTILDGSKLRPCSLNHGNEDFLPPEMLRTDKHSKGDLNATLLTSGAEQIDLFSYGCCALHLGSGVYPKPESAIEATRHQSLQLTELVRRGRYVKKIDSFESSLFHPIIVKCLSNKPSERGTFSDVLAMIEGYERSYQDDQVQLLKKMRNLEGERDNLKTQLTEAKKRESTLNTKLMEAQKLMEITKRNLENERDSLRSELSAVKEKHFSSETTLIKTQRSLESTKRDLENERVKLGGAKKRESSLNSKLIEVQKSLETAKLAHVKEKEEIKRDILVELHQLQKHNSALHRQLVSVRAEKMKLEEERKKLLSELVSSNLRATLLRDQLEETEKREEDSQVDLREMKDHLVRTSEELKRMENLLAEEQLNSTHLQAQLSEAKDEFRHEREWRTKLREENLEYENTNMDLLVLNDDQKRTLKSLYAQMELLQAKLYQSAIKAAATEEDLKLLRKEKTDMMELIDVLKQKLSSSQSEVDVLKRNLEKCNARLADTEIRLKISNEELKFLQTQAERLSKEVQLYATSLRETERNLQLSSEAKKQLLELNKKLETDLVIFKQALESKMVTMDETAVKKKKSKRGKQPLQAEKQMLRFVSVEQNELDNENKLAFEVQTKAGNIQYLAHETELEKRCWIPFGFQTITVGQDGGTFALQPLAKEFREDHGIITLEVPEGAVNTAVCDKLCIRYGVIVYGPFDLPEGYQLGSMAVYIYFNQDHAVKPFVLCLPHWSSKEGEGGLQCAVAPFKLEEEDHKYRFQVVEDGDFHSVEGCGLVQINGQSSLFTHVFKERVKAKYYASPAESRGTEGSELDVTITYCSKLWLKLLDKYRSPRLYSVPFEFLSDKIQGRMDLWEGRGWKAHVVGSGVTIYPQVVYGFAGYENGKELKSAVEMGQYPPVIACRTLYSQALQKTGKPTKTVLIINGIQNGDLRFSLTAYEYKTTERHAPIGLESSKSSSQPGAMPLARGPHPAKPPSSSKELNLQKLLPYLPELASHGQSLAEHLGLTTAWAGLVVSQQDPVSRLQELLTKWLDGVEQTSSPHTLKFFISVVRKVEKGRLADRIEEDLDNI